MRSSYHRPHNALYNISFSVPNSETLGILDTRPGTGLRESLIDAEHRNLKRYERENLKQALVLCARSTGIFTAS